MSTENRINLSESELNIGNTNQSEELDDIEIQEARRQKALEVIAENGYISYTEDGQIVADIDSINQYTSADTGEHAKLMQKLRQIYGAAGFNVLQEVFHEKPVISHEDWEKGVTTAKSMFYDPISDQAALDKRAISESSFYLNPAQGNRKVIFSELNQVNTSEAELALYTYHPDYGNGFRDPKSGQLMVKDSSNHYEPISYDYFVKNYNFDPRIDDRKGGGFASSPKQFFQTKGLHLIESGIFNENDFSSMSREVNPDTKEVDQNGFVYLDGVRYFIGKGLDQAKIEKTNNLAFVRQGEADQITHYFNLQPSLVPEKGQVITLTAEQTGLQSFNRNEFMQQRPDENTNQYNDRIESLLAIETKPILTENLSVKDKAKMKLISQQNWSHINNHELGAQISGDFARLIDENIPSRFYKAEVNSEIVGFIRFDDISSTEVYAGSLNVDENSRGAQIGEGIIKSCLLREAETKIVTGTAYPKLPITGKYLTPQKAGGYGFVATGLVQYGETHVPFFKMEIDQMKNKEYSSSRLSIDEIQDLYHKNQYNQTDEIIVLKFNPNIDLDSMAAQSYELFENGRVMTSFVTDPKDETYKYLVFEKKKTQSVAQPENNLDEAA
ncbi:MAG: hypothetical protein WCP93_01185 [Candidatus Berkelbacteria bacterium]